MFKYQLKHNKSLRLKDTHCKYVYIYRPSIQIPDIQDI